MTTIKVSSNIQDLNGQGSEILIDSQGNVLAEFYNGQFLGVGLRADRDQKTITINY